MVIIYMETREREGFQFFLEGANKKEYFYGFLIVESGRRLPHKHEEKIAQVFFVSLWVKWGFPGAVEEGHSAICIDNYYFIERFFLSSAPGCDNVIVDFSGRYHGIMMESREDREGSIFLGGANKKEYFYWFLIVGQMGVPWCD